MLSRKKDHYYRTIYELCESKILKNDEFYVLSWCGFQTTRSMYLCFSLCKDYIHEVFGIYFIHV